MYDLNGKVEWYPALQFLPNIQAVPYIPDTFIPDLIIVDDMRMIKQFFETLDGCKWLITGLQ